jgi:outer membrane protein OmpA-like peptidoglycan-associated protein
MRFSPWEEQIMRAMNLGLALATVGLLAGQAAAQGLDTERFKPALDSQGMVLTEAGQGERSGDLTLGLYLHYSHDPLVVKNRLDGSQRSLVEHRLGLSFLVALGITDWLSVGIEVPASLYQSGALLGDGGESGSLADAALGDIRVAPKLTLLREDRFGVALALVVPVSLPSGDERAYLGSDSVTASPTLALSGTLFDRLTLALNLGFWVKGDTSYRDLSADHEMFYRAGALFRFDDAWALSGEGQGSARLLSLGSNKPNETALEWVVALHYRTPWDVRLTLGGAMGSLPGWGTPDGRAFLGLSWEPRVRDTDGDGIEDADDRCPQEPGPADNQGCPWKDSDGDGLTDDQDRCPQEPGPVDNQGCPWGDKDQDGVTDNLDRCPDEPGPADNQGCPWGDKDQDGVTDNLDRCPDEPGPVDNQGCPWPDRDQDGVPDHQDMCPDDPGPADNQGCPKKTKVLVVVRKEKIEILDKIYFDTGKATIQKRSFGLLEQIAQTLRIHPEIKKVRIEGHTDSQGSDAFNLKLSQERADSVRKHLIETGKLEDGRLEAKGFGEERPVASNNTARGREQNRRVEFVILDE